MPVPTSALRERSAETARLEAALDAALAGSGRTVVIEGAAGIGKTSLIAEVRERVRELGVDADVLTARASELESRFPFGMVHQLFDDLVYGATDEAREALFTGAARMARELFDDTQLVDPGGEDVFPKLHGLFWLCVNRVAERPLVVLFDDAQWADDPSMQFLTFLARRIDDLPILLVAGTRTVNEHLNPVLAQVVTDAQTEVLRPAALSEATVEEWVRSVVDDEVDPAFAHACHTATGGNPFLLTELLREVSTARLEATAAAAHRVGALAPGGVSAVVLRRLREMPEGSVALARAVSVLGDGVAESLAARLAGLDRDAARAAASALCRAQILEDREGLGFTHPVVRATIDQGMTPGERSEAHARAAELLAEREASLDVQAAHLLATEPRGDRALVATLRAAAARASALGAVRNAVTYLDRALAEPPPEDERVDLLIELGRAESRVGAPEAVRHLEEAVALAEDVPTRARAVLELARRLKFSGQGQRVVGLLQAELQHAAELDPELAELIEVELISSGYLSVGARAALADRIAQQEDPGRPPRTVLEAWTIAGLAFDTSANGTSAELAAERARRAMVGELLPDEITASGYGRLMAGVAAMWADHFDDAARMFASTIAGARQRGSRIALATAHSISALNNWRIGALADAEADAQVSLEISSDMPGMITFRTTGQAIAALVAIERGAPEDELREHVAAMSPELQDTDSLPYHLVFHARGWLHIALGDVRSGLNDLLAGMHREQEWGAWCPAPSACRTGAVEAYALLGERDEALALAADDVERARRFGAPRALGMALRAQALAAADDTSVATLEEAVAVLEPSAARLELTRAIIDLGAALRVAGRAEEARDPLRRGQELAARVGADVLGARAHRELIAAGARPRRIALSGVDALTPSERRVSDLAAAGKTNREIAETLFVTAKTVENHLAKAFAKLGVRNRGELAEALGESVAA